jgi:hypothetical protein
VLAPNGREQYAPGDSVTIEWTGVDGRDPVRLSYSTDAGATWTVITERATGLRHGWRVPPASTGDAYVRAELWQPRAVVSTIDFPRHIGVISGGGFAPDGSRLATVVRRPGHPDNADIFVFDAATRSQTRQISLRARDVNVIAWTPDGAAILIAGTINSTTDTSARIVDATTGAVRQVFRGHRDRVVSGALTPDGALAATGSFDRTVRIWSVATGALVESIDSFRASVGAIAFSPDGTRMATGGGVGEGIQIFEVGTWTPLVAIRADSLNRSYGAIKELAFSPDGRFLLGATEAYGATIWDVASGRAVHSLLQRRGEVLRASWSPSGRYVATGRDSVLVFDAATGEKLLQFPGARYPLGLLDFSSDGAGIVAGGRDSTPRLMSLTGPAIAEDRSDRTFGIGMAASVDVADGTRITLIERSIVVARRDRSSAELVVYDMLGRIVRSKRIQEGEERGTLRLDDAARGVYLVVLRTRTRQQSAVVSIE